MLVRRYQNKDGSLTSAGRKHYGYSNNSIKRTGLYEDYLSEDNETNNDEEVEDAQENKTNED